jgi:hypothetical protein
MASWLASSTEHGGAPESVRVVFEDRIAWPGQDEPEQVFLVEHTMADGARGIGFTGPTTFSFTGVDLEGIEPEELVTLYVGWFVAFTARSAGSFDALACKQYAQQTERALTEAGYTDEHVTDALNIEEAFYWSATAKTDAGSVVVLGSSDMDECLEFDDVSEWGGVTPIYALFGMIFDPYEDDDEDDDDDD